MCTGQLMGGSTSQKIVKCGDDNSSGLDLEQLDKQLIF